MMRILSFILIAVIAHFSLMGQATNKQQNTDQNEKIIKLESENQVLDQRIKNLENVNELKSIYQNEKINDLRNTVYTLIVIVVGLLSYLVYDRRSALGPLERKIAALERRDQSVIDTIEEMAKNNIKLVSVLFAMRNPGNSLHDEEDLADYEENVNELMNSPLFRTADNG